MHSQQHDGLENTKQVGVDSVLKFPIYWIEILDSIEIRVVNVSILDFLNLFGSDEALQIKLATQRLISRKYECEKKFYSMQDDGRCLLLSFTRSLRL